MTNAMTATVNELIANGDRNVAKFAQQALALIAKNENDEPSMIVGRPGAESSSLEDEGRTLVLAVAEDCPKLYACINETGGATIMLADEY